MFVTAGQILVSTDNKKKKSDRLIKEPAMFHLRNLISIGAC